MVVSRIPLCQILDSLLGTVYLAFWGMSNPFHTPFLDGYLKRFKLMVLVLHDWERWLCSMVEAFEFLEVVSC